MKTKNIDLYSRREFEKSPWWDIVYEWEDELCAHSNRIKLVQEKKVVWLLNSIVRHAKLPVCGSLASLLGGGRLCLTFDMSAKHRTDFRNRKNVIPVVIDFFLSPENYPVFEAAYKHNSKVLITSREVYEKLKQANVKVNIAHWALSLPDRYAITADTRFEKKYDFGLVGRPNPVLREYLERYAEKHPDVTYVQAGAKSSTDEQRYHYYTNRGEHVGCFKSREEYIKLIRMTKMALYSTPAIDNARNSAHGLNQVTPRFLENIAAGCQMLLRYPDNPDTRYYELEKFCPNIQSYEQFETIVDKYRRTDVDMAAYSVYLKKHYTSTRVEELNNIFNEL